MEPVRQGTHSLTFQGFPEGFSQPGVRGQRVGPVVCCGLRSRVARLGNLPQSVSPIAASQPPVHRLLLEAGALGTLLLSTWLFLGCGNPGVRSPPRPSSLSSQKGQDPRGVGAVLLREALLAKGPGRSVSGYSVSPSRHLHPPAAPHLAHGLGKPPGFALKDQVAVKFFPSIWQHAALAHALQKSWVSPAPSTPPWAWARPATAQERQGSGRMASPRAGQSDDDNGRKVKDLVPALPVFVHS